MEVMDQPLNTPFASTVGTDWASSVEGRQQLSARVKSDSSIRLTIIFDYVVVN